ncbi:outer membrane lipoprotein-sorting protein [Pontibacter sp. JH31]|uniref:Outer membrane lipoprotein-sorting protein n=1 Tax=Pontibacter aquaedesilientis TaxID=2766980 RepID=A0ABR7XH05_9BACT|nr:outer membrane lipoprotein-sorting protein [Pontibacter aquaedesilientis]MBD1397572.1 outer membrane lipoprotein-sorting protein [Pontibacter aquaedesilientis]
MKKALLRYTLYLLIPFLALSCTNIMNQEASKPQNGQQVIEAMYRHWDNKWYPNFSFDQKAIFYENDQVSREEVWQEIYSYPSNLHIRFDGFETGNGIIYHQDTLYTFKAGKLQNKQYSIHPLVLLSFDVYFFPPATTISKAHELNFDLSKFTETKWQGHDTYVVGATDLNDNTSNQFWVDKENLYVVRVITNNKGIARDVEMNNYRLIDGNMVATEIIFKNNGKLFLREEYFNISFPKEVDQSWFDPAAFTAANWK